LSQISRELQRAMAKLELMNERLVVEINKQIKLEADKTLKKVIKYTPKGSGDLKKSWKMEEKGSKNSSNYTITIYNTQEYASFVEEGFESHFVPGYWSGKRFIYDPNASGGMYVGKPGTRYKGRYMLKRATKNVYKRIDRDISRIVGRMWKRG